VTAEANPQVSTFPVMGPSGPGSTSGEPQAHEDPLPGTEKAGVGARKDSAHG